MLPTCVELPGWTPGADSAGLVKWTHVHTVNLIIGKYAGSIFFKGPSEFLIMVNIPSDMMDN